MSIKKLLIGLAAAALALSASVSLAGAQTTCTDVASCTALINSLTQSLAALEGGTTGGAGYVFTNNLTVGSRGADVEALQQILIGDGYLDIEAPTGYFGNLTKAALAKWQAGNDISPAAGYFGPLTRAEMNKMAAAPAPTPATGPCTGGALFNSVTGASCTTSTTLPAGCTSTAGYSPTTGVKCDSTTSTTPTTPTAPQTTEGLITTKLAANPPASANIRSTTDVPVYGIEVEAINSDMTVDRIDLQVSVTPSGGSAENPGIFLRNIKVLDGTALLNSFDVTTSSFSKDSSDRYHMILSGLGFKVTKGTKKDLKVTFSVASISSTDVNRSVVVQGYAGNSNNIRATDSAGLQSYTDMSGSANSRTHTFKPAGSSTLTASINNSLTPKEQNVRISTTNGAPKTKVLGFNAKAESGAAKITKVYVQTGRGTSTVALPDTLYLCDGSDTNCSNPLGSVSGATTGVDPQVVFTSLSIPVLQDTTKSFFIAADYASDSNTQVASTSLPANAVQWEKPDGSTASTSNTALIAGKNLHLFDAVPKYTLLSATADAPSTVSSNITNGTATTTLSYHLKIRADAVGGSMVKPVIGDFVLYFASTTASTTLTDADTLTFNGYSPLNGGSAYVATSSTGLVAMAASTTWSMSGLTPTDATVGDGSGYEFTLNASIVNRCATQAIIGNACGGTNTAGNYRLILVAASSTVGSNQFLLNGALPQTWGLDSFETPSTAMPSS